MHFKREILYDVIDDIDELTELHYEELTLHKEYIPLDPDWDRYRALEKSNNLYLYTARDEGKLVGYSAFFVNSHIHYKQTLTAINDVLFLHPQYRKNSCGPRFITFCDRELTALGPIKILWHVKFSRDFRPILHRLGYVDEEVICGKMAGV